MKILGLIPARGGSKGIRGKNSKLLAGKALIEYSITAGLASRSISELVVSTDDETIARISEEAGAKVPFLRPAALATDHSPTLDAVIHALRALDLSGQSYEAVCLLQPTCPLRTAADIDAAVERFIHSGADSLISVREVPHHYNPHWVFEPTNDGPFLQLSTGEATIIPRRQDLPPAFHRDGSIYLTKREVLLELGSLYGEKITYYINRKSVHVNIDTPEDWQKAEQILLKMPGRE